MKQIVLVENMSCQHCVKQVRSHFLGMNGVSDVVVHLETKEVAVTTAVQHRLSDFQTSLVDTVYEAVAIKE